MSSNGEIRIEELVGTWQLVGVPRTITETGEIIDLTPKGTPPFGILTYGNEGRMLVLNLTSGRPKPDSLEAITAEQRVQLFRTMLAYGGTDTIDGNIVSHHIDISWNEVWTGTTQIRTVTREGGRFVYATTSPAPGALDGKLGTVRLVRERLKQ